MIMIGPSAAGNAYATQTMAKRVPFRNLRRQQRRGCAGWKMGSIIREVSPNGRLQPTVFIVVAALHSRRIPECCQTGSAPHRLHNPRADRDFTIDDPTGVLWRIGQNIKSE